MKKVTHSKSKYLQPFRLIILILGSFVFFKAGFSQLSKSTGDYNSLCEVKPENAQISELNWGNAPVTFYYLSDKGLFSQVSNSSESVLLAAGQVSNFQLARKLNKIVFIESNSLWLIDKNGTQKTLLTKLPDSLEIYLSNPSPDNTTVVLELINPSQTKSDNTTEKDLMIVNLVTKDVISKKAALYETLQTYQIPVVRHQNKSLSPDGRKNIELNGGEFWVNGQELFYCGVIRGSLQASGPACFQHSWLPDNDHIVLDLCGTVVVETSTGKVARLNNGRNFDWW